MLEEFVDRILLFFHRVHQKLWVKPLMMCLLSVISILLARGLEGREFLQGLPLLSVGSVKTLLRACPIRVCH